MMVEIMWGVTGWTTWIGTQMAEEESRELIKLLSENHDVFAWKPEDLVGIDPMVTTHRLNVKPIKQNKRHFGVDKEKIIEEEVQKLLKAGHIREIRYPTWVSNAVLVKKGKDKWRMCIDFRDLNKAGPKDYYLLPRIDQLVDSMGGCEMLSMMDASQGYHQILLDREDQDKVSFITSSGTYCYRVMPFGLKNAGATYQRLVDKMFHGQIGSNLEIYVDDTLVKSTKAQARRDDLKETFTTLRKYNMKLNPAKCAFRVRAGKFLGYMVTERGVRVNPEKAQAIIEMQPPRNIKEVQILTGSLTALSHFISKVAKKTYPFFKILRQGAEFSWDKESAKAFEKLKNVLASLPLLAKPEKGERLYVYL